MSDRLFNERLLSHLTKIPIKALKSGSYSSEEKETIYKANDWLKTRKFTHLYLPSWTKEELYITAKKLQRKNNMQFFIMDYFKSRTGTDASTVYNELGDAVNFVKNDILGELGISGCAAAQLNRGGEIGDSYKIEQYASTILTLKRKKQKEVESDGEECGNYKLFVKLNRLGDQMGDIENDYIDLVFRGEVATFVEAEKQHDSNATPFD
jgi:replicative DNA helicase